MAIRYDAYGGADKKSEFDPDFAPIAVAERWLKSKVIELGLNLPEGYQGLEAMIAELRHSGEAGNRTPMEIAAEYLLHIEKLSKSE